MKLHLIFCLIYISLRAFSEESTQDDICIKNLLSYNLRGSHDFTAICKDLKNRKSVTENSEPYKKCVILHNSVIPARGEHDYFKKCQDINFLNMTLDQGFSKCLAFLVSTKKSFNIDLSKICLDQNKRKLILSETFLNCSTLLLKYGDDRNPISVCMDKKNNDFFQRSDFKKCLQIKEDLGDTTNASKDCSQTDLLKIIHSSEFQGCVEKLKGINIYRDLSSKCTSPRFIKQILNKNFEPCIMKLQAISAQDPLNTCLESSKSEIINSLSFDQCHQKLAKLEAKDSAQKCIDSRNLSKYLSNDFDICIADFISYNKVDLDTFCLENKFNSIRAKREVIACMDEIKTSNPGDVFQKCSRQSFIRYINSAHYQQCKSSLNSLELTHLSVAYCQDFNVVNKAFKGSETVCLANALKVPENKILLDTKSPLLDAIGLLNKIITSCRAKLKGL